MISISAPKERVLDDTTPLGGHVLPDSTDLTWNSMQRAIGKERICLERTMHWQAWSSGYLPPALGLVLAGLDISAALASLEAGDVNHSRQSSIPEILDPAPFQTFFVRRPQKVGCQSLRSDRHTLRFPPDTDIHIR